MREENPRTGRDHRRPETGEGPDAWALVAGSVLALTVSLGPVIQYSFGVFVKPLSIDLGADRSLVSLAPTLAVILIGLALPVVGGLVDRFGVKRVTLASIALTSLTLLSLGICPANIYAFIAIYCLAGVLATGFSPLPFAKAIAARFTLRRGLALGVTMAGVGIGTALVPPLAQELIVRFGWRMAYAGFGVMVFVIAFPAVLLTMRSTRKQTQAGKSDAGIVHGLSARNALRDTLFWQVGLAFFILALTTGGIMTHVAALLSDRGVSAERAASAISVGGIALIVGRLMSGFLLDRIFAPFVALFFFAAPVAGLIVLIFGTSMALGLLGTSLVGLGIGAEVDLIGFLIARYFGQRAFGTIFGYQFMIFVFGAALGPYFMGLCYAQLGRYEPAMYVFAAGLLVACVLVGTLARYRYNADGTPVARRDAKNRSPDSGTTNGPDLARIPPAAESGPILLERHLMNSQRSAQHWIAGAWSKTGSERQSIDPATGKPIGIYADGGADVARSAIEAAKRAFVAEDWRTNGFLRATALSHLADKYEARQSDIVETLCLENGKLRYEAAFEVGFIVRSVRFAAGLAMQNFGRVIEARPGQQSLSIRQPIGVAGLIIPWNSPAYLMIRALAPALATGCTAVVKMPAQAAQSAMIASEIIASVPELGGGVVNIFIEAGADGARLLVDSPDVAVVSFTGSTHTGRLIAQAAASKLKRVGLELGGKTPHLVFDDADLNAVLPVLEKSSTVFAGQFCMTGSRILVQRGIADRLKAGLVARLKAVKVGPAADPTSDMGPLIDKASVKRVDAAVEEALRLGATALLRGGPAREKHLADGAFFHPTVLEVSDSKLAIVRNEIFGPVQTIQVFDTEDEAIALANDSEYGLSACVWSRDIDRPIRVARRLEAGLVSINSWANLVVECEEGGFKSSGLGRLGGLASVDDFLEYKQITQNFAGGH